MSTITIRQEQPSDYSAVFQLIEAAFKTDPHSDGSEQHLVERLRKSQAFIPELSLVAELDGQVVGHLLISKITIKNDEQSQEELSLAPVSVLPQFQGRGIGSALIKKGHEIAANLGFGIIVLLGHETYYPKFGYQQADLVGIRFPFEAPLINCMVVELQANALSKISGTVEYPPEFFQGQ